MKMFGGEQQAVSEGHNNTIIEFMVSDVDREYERIKTPQIASFREPTTTPWGNRSLLFSDPDGNLINFFLQ
jgi:predicted enzyme related to lactoylglutathione lyase